MTRPPGVLVPTEVNAATVRRGDLLTIGGKALVVRDLINLPAGGKRLAFDSGESFTMRPTTVLTVNRRVTLRRWCG
ncbi:hypothetical protein [Streptomyces mayteni]